MGGSTESVEGAEEHRSLDGIADAPAVLAQAGGGGGIQRAEGLLMGMEIAGGARDRGEAPHEADARAIAQWLATGMK